MTSSASFINYKVSFYTDLGLRLRRSWKGKHKFHSCRASVVCREIVNEIVELRINSAINEKKNRNAQQFRRPSRLRGVCVYADNATSKCAHFLHRRRAREIFSHARSTEFGVWLSRSRSKRARLASFVPHRIAPTPLNRSPLFAQRADHNARNKYVKKTRRHSSH